MAHLQWDFYNYVASLWLTGITTLSLGAFVYFKNRHAKLNKLFLAVSISIAIWGFGQGCIHSNYTLSFTAARIIHFFVPFIAALFFHIITVLAEKPHKKFLIFSYTAAALFSILSGFTKTVVASNPTIKISDTFTLLYSVGPGKLYIPYLIFFMLVVSYGNLILYRAYRESSGTKRNQLKYMLIGSVIGFIGGASNFLYVFGINLYPLIPYATYMVTFYVIITAYAMIKHRLMDVKIALSRTGLLLLIYGLIIYASFQSMVFLQPYLQKNLGDKWLLFPIVMYMLLATATPFIYLYAQRKMEEKLFKTQRRYQKTLKQLSGKMTRIRNLTKLLDLTAIQIIRNVGLSHVDIFLYNKDKNRYILKTSRGRSRKQPGLELKTDNILIKTLYCIKGPLAFDEISNYGNKAIKAFKETTLSLDTESLKQAMKNLGAAVCMPGFIENHLIGFLVLGEKLEILSNVVE
ncbi:MAG: histidine kinase N-terminal 7TM domain-containing protein [Candidatus Orphnella occulta]|nr:histidine kinase N-terminal 7TM domain-containing protein [Candidatus Orphnella occulta]